MTDLPTYVLERTFDAPREMVWRTWTEPELVARWYGPNVETVVHRMDVKAGGLWLLEMRMRGASNYQRVEYLEVNKPERLVWLHSNADADWNIIASPMMKDWPRVLLTTVTLERSGAQTALRLTWVPHEATPAEIACFRAAVGGMDKGWAAGMEMLKKLLEEMQG
jgi:uncharacterized protein YndB with AHSA1/START domain